MSKITHLFEAIEQVALSESVEQYHFEQAHAHNNMGKEAQDKALNHAVAAEQGDDQWEKDQHAVLHQFYKKASDIHAKLAANHGAKHDKLKASVRS